ncbi:MAG: heavy-metal-associated domain-containing protein [Tepidisphaerales bacterium]
MVVAMLAGCQAGSGLTGASEGSSRGEPSAGVTASPPSSREEPVPPAASGAGATVVRLDVHGLSCPLCANNLDRELLRLPGVEAVRVDLGSGRVEVTYGAGATADRAAIAEAVRRSGFTLAGFR